MSRGFLSPSAYNARGRRVGKEARERADRQQRDFAASQALSKPRRRPSAAEFAAMLKGNRP